MSKTAKNLGPTMQEASAQAGVSYQRIGQLIKVKKMRTYKSREKITDVRIRIDADDWEKYMKEREAIR